MAEHEILNSSITIIAHLIIKGALGYGLYRLIRHGISRYSIITAHQQGRWIAGWLVGLSALGIRTSDIDTGNYYNLIAYFVISTLSSFIIGYFIGLIWFKIKKKNKFGLKIEEKHWELAEKEFSTERKNGVWAEAYSSAKGDENLAKANYLKKRATEIANAEDLSTLAITASMPATTTIIYDSGDDAASKFKWVKIVGVIFIPVVLGSYFIKLNIENSPAYQFERGSNYYYGNGNLPKDSNKAFIYFKKSAEQGNIEAQNKIAEMYRKGEGIATDSTQAFYWYKKSAEQGNADSQINLGFFFKSGWSGIQIDKAQAVYWFTKSAEQGNSDAQWILGDMYEWGLGIQRDSSKAFYWFTKSAEQGNSNAQNALGFMYEWGFGIQRDNSKAFYWFTKSAEQGNSDAQNALGFIYLRGVGVQKDDAKAFYWFEKSALQGNTEAEMRIAVSYEEGIGVKKDAQKAIYWYEKSAEQGNVKSQVILGLSYLSGTSIVQEDHKKALFWLKKSAEQGNKDAQFGVGLIYEQGLGVAVNYREAANWYKKASEQGNVDATKKYKNLKARKLI